MDICEGGIFDAPAAFDDLLLLWWLMYYCWCSLPEFYWCPMASLLGCIMVIGSPSVVEPLKVFKACGSIYVPLISANVLAFEVLCAS